MSTLQQFAFKLTHPVMYAHTIVVQAVDYNAALPFAQAHVEGSLWTIDQAKNMQTGEVIQNA